MRPKCSHLHASATSTGRSWRGFHTSKPRSSTPRATSWRRPSTTCSSAAALALPENIEEIEGILAICSEARVPVTPVAGDSSVCGQSVPVAGGLVLDLSRLDGVLELDEESLAVTVEPGVYGHHLEAW